MTGLDSEVFFFGAIAFHWVKLASFSAQVIAVQEVFQHSILGTDLKEIKMLPTATKMQPLLVALNPPN